MIVDVSGFMDLKLTKYLRFGGRTWEFSVDCFVCFNACREQKYGIDVCNQIKASIVQCDFQKEAGNFQFSFLLFQKMTKFRGDRQMPVAHQTLPYLKEAPDISVEDETVKIMPILKEAFGVEEANTRHNEPRLHPKKEMLRRATVSADCNYQQLAWSARKSLSECEPEAKLVSS